MTRLFSRCFAGLLVITAFSTAVLASSDDPGVNAVIGDESYLVAFGHAPTTGSSELLRVQTHLRYVEALLRTRSTDHLSDAQRETRARYLDLLRAYWQEGSFPHNDGHSDTRRPTFISVDGNICAVGYLVEQSVGREVAEAVNRDFKYAFIGEIDSPIFEAWAEESGFTIEELAMIQPMYGEIQEVETNRNRVEPAYALGSTALALANTYTMASGTADPWLGLAAGGATVILGVLNLDNRTLEQPMQICMGFDCTIHYETNHLRAAVSYANVGVGAANMLLSGFRLLSGRAAEAQPGTHLMLTQLQSPREPADSVPGVQLSVRF